MHRQTGVALITALLITALVTVIAVAMASEQQLDIRRTSNIMDTDRAFIFGLGVESWAKEILRRDRQNSKTDDLTEDWAVVLPPLSVEDATVSGHIVDMTGRFNLNDLVQQGKADTVSIEEFKRLLAAVGLNPDLAMAVVDWIDPDSQVSFPAGAEDTEYMNLTPPYRAANQPMVSPSELLLVKGFDLKSYRKLAPYVAALPEPTQVNVNTASAPVLMAVVQGLSEADAKGIVDDLKKNGFKTLGDFKKRVSSYTVSPNVGVQSSYFLAESETHFGRGRMQLYSLLSRAADGKVTTITRSEGVY